VVDRITQSADKSNAPADFAHQVILSQPAGSLKEVLVAPHPHNHKPTLPPPLPLIQHHSLPETHRTTMIFTAKQHPDPSVGGIS
jgi:hypothetical protein